MPTKDKIEEGLKLALVIIIFLAISGLIHGRSVSEMTHPEGILGYAWVAVKGVLSSFVSTWEHWLEDWRIGVNQASKEPYPSYRLCVLAGYSAVGFLETCLWGLFHTWFVLDVAIFAFSIFVVMAITGDKKGGGHAKAAPAKAHPPGHH